MDTNTDLKLVKGVRLIKAFCCLCSKRADYAVTQSNEDLFGKRDENGLRYMTDGNRVVYYCEEHMPKEYQDFFLSM